MPKRSSVTITVLALLALSGPPVFSCCAMKTSVPSLSPPKITAVDIPAGNGGETVTWTVSWNGGQPPYTITISMGGGAQADLPSGTPAISPFQADFTLVNGSFDLAEFHTFVVVVTDAAANSTVAQGMYEVGPTPPPRLSIEDLSYDADSGLLRVIADPDGWGSLLAELTLPAGMIADASERWMAIEDGEAAAEFYVYPEDVLAAAAGELGVKVYDPYMMWITPVYETLSYNCSITLGEGVLAAVPQRRHVTADEPVLVVVACGDFPANKPFQYMNGIGVTIDYGTEYVDGSWNLGAPGGGRIEVDGMWVDMVPQPDSFVLPADYMIQLNDIGGGRLRIDLNHTPIGGGNTYTGGMLTNFQFRFTEPKTYTLGFQEFKDIKRTYYSDTNSTEYYWADISNDYPGVPNSVTVSGT